MGILYSKFELAQETKGIRMKLQNMKQKKMVLSAEVRYSLMPFDLILVVYYISLQFIIHEEYVILNINSLATAGFWGDASTTC